LEIFMTCGKFAFVGAAALLAATATLTLPASAADVYNGGSLKDAPEPYVAPRNWDGFYIGAHVGHAWGDFEASDVDPVFDALIAEDLNHDPQGWLYGGQIGYNWQMQSQWVFGVEADIAGSEVDGGVTYDFPFGIGDNFTDAQTMELQYFATIRGRLGYDTGGALLFLTAGYALAKVDANFATTLIGPGPIPDGALEAGDSNTHGGWVVGAGFETWLRDNISLKAEYLYADLDEEIYQPVATVAGEPFEFTVQTIRVGINVHF
jgi:outer membrane immunogenic protein